MPVMGKDAASYYQVHSSLALPEGDSLPSAALLDEAGTATTGADEGVVYGNKTDTE